MGLRNRLRRIAKHAVQRAKPAFSKIRAIVVKDDREHQNLLTKARVTGDAFGEGAPYYAVAEPDMDQQWEALIWPMIQEADFDCVLDLAAGHGRNSAKLCQHARQMILVDINQSNIDACKKRFKGDKRFTFIKNNGISLKGVRNNAVSLVYTFDSMVHFDSDVVREYLREFYRVLRPGGHAFCHHSNYTDSPGNDFTENPGWRNFMSRELFAHYALKAGLSVIKTKLLDWSYPELDCMTLLQKPR